MVNALQSSPASSHLTAFKIQFVITVSSHIWNYTDNTIIMVRLSA